MSKAVTLPDDWRERIEILPNKAGAATVASALGLTISQVYSLRKRDAEVNQAIIPKLGCTQRLLSSNEGKPLHTQTLCDEELRLALSRAFHYFDDYFPNTKEYALSMHERTQFADLFSTTIATLENLLKERRHLRSELNQTKTRIHQLKRGGTPQVHASNGIDK